MKKEERKLLKEMKAKAMARKEELNKKDPNKKRAHNKDLKLKVYKTWKKNKKITKDEILELFPEAQEQSKSIGAWFSHWKAGRSIPEK